MKKNDLVPVNINGIGVTNAVVEAVETDKVTLVIPATRVVMAVRMQLTDEKPVDNTGTERVIDEVVRQDAPPAAPAPTPVEAPAPTEVPPAPAPAETPTEAPKAEPTPAVNSETN